MLKEFSFTSVDPAPPSEDVSKLGPQAKADIPALRDTLLNSTLPLFRRYRAMFALRDIGTSDAIDALVEGFRDDSALFK